MDDLLKEAIADAKAVRETALQNAKIALEEAFTPRLQSMLSKKIQNEVESEDETEDMDEVEGEDDDKDVDVSVSDEDEVPAEEMMGADEDYAEQDEVEIQDEDEDEVEGDEVDAMSDDEGDDDEDDLDLESIIKELEAEDEGEGDDDLEEIANDVSSGIGSGDNKEPSTEAQDDNQVDPEGESGEEPEKAVYDESEEAPEDLDEVIDLEEVLAALKEEDDDEEDDEVDESAEKVKEIAADLKEHRKVIKFLKVKLNEVNLLNAKLLFTNKLFKNYSLNNSQKMKVVETFDRAGSLREVKLVYSTLAESFNYGNSVSKKGTNVSITEGKASKPVKSTKPSKKVINEGDDLANRFKKLAGLL